MKGGRIGEEFVCRVCGKISVRSRANQQICDECREEEERKKRYGQIKSYHQTMYNGVYKTAESTYVKPKYNLREVAAAARKHNMTYGKYVAEWKLGNVPEPEHIEEPKKRG